MTHEPVRLLDDAAVAANLRRDLAAAARERVAYDVAGGAARFEANLAKGAGAAPAEAASAGWGAGALALGALILGGLIAGGVWMARPPAPDDAPAQVAGGGQPTARVSPPTISPPTISPPAPRVPALEPASAAAPAVTPEEPEAEALDEAIAEPVRPATRPPRTRTKKAETRKSSAVDGADYLREAKALQAARGFLGRDPGEALARAKAGADEFREGAFTQEWEGVAILALFELGRTEQARTRAEAFLARYPKGPYAGQVREALDR